MKSPRKTAVPRNLSLPHSLIPSFVRYSKFVFRHSPSFLRHSAALLALPCLSFLSGCGGRTIRIDLVPAEDRLTAQVVQSDPGAFLPKIALMDLTGLISDSASKGLLSSGRNPVSDFRETLQAIEADDSVRAVVLRINSPGGTVTASAMMYHDLENFRRRTHKPVVVSMMDLCASGGYYVSCAADYRMAYPTTLTGSIGVIVQTINFSGTLEKLGISAKALTSGPNKDMGSPLRPMTPNDEAMLQHFVTQFYAGFQQVVKDSPNHIKESDWATVTDGRVVSGKDALEFGLIDELGGLDAAIAKAKSLAGLKAAMVIAYSHGGETKGSIYAASNPPAPASQLNFININADVPELLPSAHPQFLYLWMGQ